MVRQPRAALPRALPGVQRNAVERIAQLLGECRFVAADLLHERRDIRDETQDGIDDTKHHDDLLRPMRASRSLGRSPSTRRAEERSRLASEASDRARLRARLGLDRSEHDATMGFPERATLLSSRSASPSPHAERWRMS